MGSHIKLRRRVCTQLASESSEQIYKIRTQGGKYLLHQNKRTRLQKQMLEGGLPGIQGGYLERLSYTLCTCPRAPGGVEAGAGAPLSCVHIWARETDVMPLTATIAAVVATCVIKTKRYFNKNWARGTYLYVMPLTAIIVDTYHNLCKTNKSTQLAVAQFIFYVR
jgi:hypothetical protein